MGGLAAAVLAALIALACGCGPLALLRYAVSPDPPELSAGEEIALAALAGPVEVTRRADGLWRIEAESERDALVAQGYLLARDRLAQLDLLRHLAHGRLAALLGLRAFGDRTTLDVDRQNRFLGFSDTARRLAGELEPVTPQRRAGGAVATPGLEARCKSEGEEREERDGRACHAGRCVRTRAGVEAPPS